MAEHDLPPMDPDTDEASAEQFDAARAQGEAYGRALQLMIGSIAHDGGEQRAGDYVIGYAVEKAEGMYYLNGGELVWKGPGQRTSVSRWRCGTRLTAASCRASMCGPR